VNRILAVAILLMSVSARSAVWNAASPSFSDVSNSVSSAANNDTVVIPAGYAFWTNSLTIYKAVSISGAGIGSTVIGGNVDLINYTLSSTNDYPFRLTGISFTNVTGKLSVLISGSAGVSAARIDHCSFDGGTRALYAWKRVWSVFDHNTFTNCNIAIGSTGDNDDAWARTNSVGTTNCVVIEDCTFGIPPLSNLEHQIYHQEGTRTALRNNTFIASTGDPAFLDAHGNQNYYSGTSADFRGTVFLEAYRNTFSMTINNYRWTYLRGGNILFFSNTVSDLSGTTPLINFTEEEAWQTNFFSPLRTNWPAQDQITNSFIWGNTRAGTNIYSIAIDDPSTNFIKVNRDYWLEAPNATNGSPAGILAGYAPLVYPHPWVTATDGRNFRATTARVGTVSSP
jgi:hypothetical protein